MTALLLRLYPARWRARYDDEFAVVLESRPLGPFDVADVLLGALDAHLHLRGLGAASEHRKGFAMSLRIGGYAAILGGLLFFTGFLANAFDGSDEAWPTSGIVLAGILALLVALTGLSAFQARRHPVLVWAAFLVPALGAVVASVGAILMGLFPNASWNDYLSPWGIAMLGAWPWEPFTSLVLFALLVLFAAGRLLTGLGAIRTDRLSMTLPGGAA